MKKNDYADMTLGGLFVLLGLATFFYARSHYDMGELTNMGPGFFPSILGITMSILGLLVMLASLGVKAQKREFSLRPAFFVTLSIVAFAILIESLGALPAIVALVFLSSMSENRGTWLSKLVLALALFGIAYIVFKLMLSMNFSLINGVF